MSATIVLILMLIALLPDFCRAQEQNTKPAHSVTSEINESVYEMLDFSDRQDFEDARRGFIGSIETMVIKDEAGRVVWDMEAYDFLDSKAFETVNPSLWRQEQLNNIHGLFEVHPNIYQVRSFDLANMTLIKGNTGWIIIDPLMTKETASAALQLAEEHLGKRPVVAVFYTHTHVDHFGGVRGVVDEKDVKAGRTKIIAPEGFMKHAIAENVLAGNAMNRRAIYQFGNALPAGVRGHVGSGLGKGIPSGQIGLIPPTDIVRKTGEEMNIDGVRIVFQMASGSEAPAEFMLYFPDFKALCLAEVITHHMHNIYTLRGAQVRDSLAWSKYINEAIGLFGDKVEVSFAQHHWPTWGNGRIRDLLVTHRDLYRYMHDETLRLANMGLTPMEIAEEIKLPSSLQKQFSARGYYGTLSHNVRGIYQHYLGWYDSNPAHLNPLPPVEAAKRYVAFMGGADKLLDNARKAYEDGEFRWVAEVVNHLVFAEPGNQEAKDLQADALEQLGYQAESGVWRDEYLTGAYELRNGVRETSDAGTRGAGVMRAVPLEMVFDLLSVRLKKNAVADVKMNINMQFTDIGADYALELSNGVLHNTKGKVFQDADATYKLSTGAFAKLLAQEVGFAQLLGAGEIKAEGNPKAIGAILRNMETFEAFNIVTP